MYNVLSNSLITSIDTDATLDFFDRKQSVIHKNKIAMDLQVFAPPAYVPGRAWLDQICINEGLPINAVRVFFALILSCILAPFFHLLPTPNSRKIPIDKLYL